MKAKSKIYKKIKKLINSSWSPWSPNIFKKWYELEMKLAMNNIMLEDTIEHYCQHTMHRLNHGNGNFVKCSRCGYVDELNS